MANIRKRNKSYEITVSCGYGIDGRQIRRTMTYTPEKGMTASRLKRKCSGKRCCLKSNAVTVLSVLTEE